jgi:prevent-host-death family protein
MCYMAGRKQVAVRELRQNLSVHLRRVKKGEVLEVTERGQPVAVLAPLPEAMTPLGRLLLSGRVLRPATRSLADLPPPLKMDLKPTLSEILQELREDRRLL